MDVSKYFEVPGVDSPGDAGWIGQVCNGCGSDPEKREGKNILEIHTPSMEPHDREWSWTCKCGEGPNVMYIHWDDCPCTAGVACEMAIHTDETR